MAAEYRLIDPLALGSDAISTAFDNQVAYCASAGAPITASVCNALRRLIDANEGGAVMDRVRKWDGPPLADALPLRVAGGLHALYLSGRETKLSALYSMGQTDRADELVGDALVHHEAFLLPWLDGPPQTNEAGRSSNFAAAMLWLASKGCPARFQCLEIGSSAGINLMMDRYHYNLGGVACGPVDAALHLKPEWRGPPPPNLDIRIEFLLGCDVAPVDLNDLDEALRLRAYIWPEHTARFSRMDAAIDAAQVKKPDLLQMNAADFAEEQLGKPQVAGVTRILMHSIVWQYVPEDQRLRVKQAAEAAGARATADKPFAWLSVEANRDTHRHETRIRYWLGGEEETLLAVAHPHGEWVEWLGA